MPITAHRIFAMIELMGVFVGVALVGSIIALALLLYFGGKRFAERSLKHAYADLEIHTVAGPNDVVLVYHTYHGFLMWHAVTEHRVTLPLDDARVLLGRLLRFNLTWGLLAKGGILIAPLAIYNYVAQTNSIAEQEASAAFAAIGPKFPTFDETDKPRRRRSWFYTIFGWLSALLGGLFAVVAISSLVTRQFEAGFGGVVLSLFMGWLARDWLRNSVTETPSSDRDLIPGKQHRDWAITTAALPRPE